MSSLSALIVIPLLSSSAVIAHHEVAEPNGPPGELLHSPDPRNSVTSTPNPAADPSEVDPSSTHYPKKEDLPVRTHGEALKERAPGWAKQIEYSGLTFFDGWDFFTAPGRSVPPSLPPYLSLLKSIVPSSWHCPLTNDRPNAWQ